MTDAPERIWIEADDECPYFYEAHELHDVEQDVIEYVRADLYAALEAQLAAERAAHAETKRERDEHKRLKNELVLKAYRAMDGADDLVEALKRYGFPVSDAAEPGLMEYGIRDAQALHKAAKAFIAARRALEGGSDD